MNARMQSDVASTSACSLSQVALKLNVRSLPASGILRQGNSLIRFGSSAVKGARQR